MQARGADAQGREAVHPGVVFQSDPEPTGVPTAPIEIWSSQATQITANSAVITWTTNVPGTSQVDYGFGYPYTHTTPVDTKLVTSHSVLLTGLQPGTRYEYRPRSIDAAGNRHNPSGFTFQTLDGF